MIICKLIPEITFQKAHTDISGYMYPVKFRVKYFNNAEIKLSLYFSQSDKTVTGCKSAICPIRVLI